MRKFRAWNKNHKKHYIVDMIDYNKEIALCDSLEGTNHTFGFNDLIFEESLQRKDRNNVDVFEGDVVQMYQHNSDSGKHEKHKCYVMECDESTNISIPKGRVLDKRKIVFLAGAFVLRPTYSSAFGDRTFNDLMRPGESIEIIGSVHEL